MPNDSQLIAKRLNKILEEQDMTANRLATLSDMRQSSLSAIFTGNSASPKLVTLRKIAEGLGMSLTELLDFPPYNQRPDGTSAAKQRSKWEQLGDALTPEERERVRNILTREDNEADK
ncbi:helix-turn-helix domain-containing protein [Schleiferilactobacillus perolens]|jgi:transcriptional regulator with XRE-family HTH domain|uniref:helix-turn-helix domain-containing protein n=1 Tax=Schleiferilactobacillus perolens TaxID=100468 RepID=UPI0023566AE2|nr:helix-turn-helix transcriptional regulator [Schleiferilactobacillus perolens]MCI2170650.1 helix-turn-helix transcriptional regulator [Schleiferilactobacillus perolens]